MQKKGTIACSCDCEFVMRLIGSYVHCQDQDNVYSDSHLFRAGALVGKCRIGSPSDAAADFDNVADVLGLSLCAWLFRQVFKIYPCTQSEASCFREKRFEIHIF